MPRGSDAVAVPFQLMGESMRLFSFLFLLLSFSAGSAESLDTPVWLSGESLAVDPPEIAEAQSAEARISARSPQESVWRMVNYVRTRGWNCGGTFHPPAEQVRWDPRLGEAAQRHSDDMAQNNFFSHTGSDGSSVAHRVREAGYDWRAIGENIAAGYATPLDAMKAWMRSPGHCRNIMNPNFEDLGVGVSENPGSRYGIYWTIDLGAHW